MLTALPPRWLHRLRTLALYVVDLTDLGLALLCSCGDDHAARRRLDHLGPA